MKIGVTLRGLLLSNILAYAQHPIERKQLFDYDWKFLFGDNTSAKSKDFDAKSWRNLDLYESNTRKAWKGRALVVIKSTRNAGDVKLTVSSPDLPAATLSIKTS